MCGHMSSLSPSHNVLIHFQDEYKEVKKRNQQLCHILAQGESKYGRYGEFEGPLEIRMNFWHVIFKHTLTDWPLKDATVN